MLFLIDGYNVTKGDPATSGLTLERQRDALIARLKARGQSLLGKGNIVIVFDGEADQVAQPADTYPVSVEFSRGRSADDAIVRAAARASGEQVCVVTSDRGLIERVRGHLGSHARTMSREAVYESAPVRIHRNARVGRVEPAETDVPKSANRITEELKKLWLDEGEE